jgi:hypothetical protein
MNKLKLTILMLFFIGSSAIAEENFGSLITKTGWDKIIGTWVDAETKGKQTKSTFAWKYEGTVLQSVTNLPDRETLSIFTFNPNTGKVWVGSADTLGASSKGEVEFTKGVATFKIAYVTEKGKAGDAEIKYTLADENTMKITYFFGEAFTMTLVRE